MPYDKTQMQEIAKQKVADLANMTKLEAYQMMLAGFKIKGRGYTSDEYAFINKDGVIETEDGCRHGGRFDEFWDKYQSDDGYTLFDEKQLTQQNAI